MDAMKQNEQISQWITSKELQILAIYADGNQEEWTKEKIQILEEQINKIFVYRTNQFLLGKLPAFVNKINFSNLGMPAGFVLDTSLLDAGMQGIIYK